MKTIKRVQTKMEHKIYPLMVKVLVTLSLIMSGCSENIRLPKAGMDSNPSADMGAELGTSSSSKPSDSVTYKQIERLARPAINEGLVITNDYLNAYNSIPPTADLSAAAAPVVAEAAAVLTAVYNYGKSAGLPAPEVGNVAGGFLPDVMRIDTSLSVPVGGWAYNADAVIVEGTSAAAMLTGGRKLEDDVMDITLSYLIAGNPGCSPSTPCTIPDGVSYSGGTTCANAGRGANVSNPGHKCLHGQTARNGNATFPFLPTPN